jgi:hypothetical protein
MVIAGKRRGGTASFAGRRGQITVFMIIGIILLFSSSLLFYIRGQVTEGIGEEFIPTIEEVPLEAQPVKVFVEDCIANIGREAVENIGKHGGYVDPYDIQLAGTAFNMGLEPTESDGILLFDRNDTLMPYWWYLKSPNTCSGNCEFDTLRPPISKDDSLYSIESQIDRYINRELPKCLNNFEAFTAQGFQITEQGPIDADARITEREIAILVNYPLQITQQDQQTDITSFYTRLDVRFKDIYEMASMIVEKESETYFLESHTLTMISLYSEPLGTERLPPIAEFTVNPNEFLFWTRTGTQDMLESYVLPITASMIQVDQTRNFQRVVMFETDEAGDLQFDAIGSGIMDNTILRLDRNFTEFDARFMYSDLWPIYLNINDREVLMPTSVSVPIISWLGFNQYVFLYTLSYPVMISIRDPESFAGDGFEFRFAIEHNLRGNKPINVTKEMVFAEEQGSLVCSQNQKQGAPVNIEVKDKMTGEPIEDVRLSLVFGSEGCHMGITDIGPDNRSVITANLPAGLGDIRAEHVDYLEYEQGFFSSPSREQNITIELMPFRYINVTAFTLPLQWDIDELKYVLPPAAPLSSLTSKEMYMFIFERQDDDGMSFTAYAHGRGPSEGTLRIVPGTYSVRGTLILNETLTIGAETLEVSTGLFGGTERNPINETVMEQWMEGGALLNNETGYWEVTQDELFSADRLNLFLLRFPIPVTHSTQIKPLPSLEQAADWEKYSDIYRTELEPEWIIG